MNTYQEQKIVIEDIQQHLSEAEKKMTASPKEVFDEIEKLLQLNNASAPKNRKDKAQHIALRVRGLNNQAYCSLILCDYPLALQKLAVAKKDLDTLLNFIEKEQFIALQARNLEISGLTKWRMGNHEEALVELDEAIKNYDAIRKEKEYFNALNNKACVYASIGEYENAIELMLKAKEYFEKTDDNEKTATILHNISGLYYDTRQNENALQTISRAIEVLNEPNSPQMIEMLNGRGLMFLASKQLDEAKADFSRALELSRLYQWIGEQIRAIVGLGNVYCEKQQFDEALEAYQEALRLQLESKSESAIFDIYKGIAFIYEQKKNWSLAREWYEKMLSSAEHHSSYNASAHACEALSRCAEAQGDYKSALEFHKEYCRYTQILTEKKQNEFFLRSKAAFLAEKMKAESEELKALNERLFKAHDTLAAIISETELQKADLEFQYSRIRALLSVLPEGILIEDEHRKIHLVNQRLLDMFEIEGKPEDFISRSADRLRVLVRNKTVESEKAQKFFEQSFYERKTIAKKEVKQVSGKIYEFSFMPLFHHGKYRGSLWTFEDITLRKMQEREREITIERLNEANTKLQNANKLKNELLAIAVHDLKNPLNVIGGFSELIYLESSSETVKSYSEAINRSVKRMLLLVQDLLQSANSEKETMINFEPTNLNQIIHYVAANQEVLAKEKNIAIHLQEKDKCMVEAEPNKLYEVFENLISNAVKYSPSGKNITVTIEKLDLKKSMMRRESDAKYAKSGVAHITIKDEGLGMSEDDLKKLYQPFQKLSSKPTANEASTGLGLYIVKNLVEKHHGKIWAESEGKGKGTTFFVELPAIE